MRWKPLRGLQLEYGLASTEASRAGAAAHGCVSEVYIMLLR